MTNLRDTGERMEEDTGADTSTHQTKQGQGDPTKSTPAAFLPSTKEGNGDTVYEQGITSRIATTKVTPTSSNDTATSLADLRPGTEIQFRALDKGAAETKQDAQITHTPKPTRHLRESIQTFRGVSLQETTATTNRLNSLRPCRR